MFDDEELGVQVVELLGKRCCVAFPCSSILRHLCLHVKVTLTSERTVVPTQNNADGRRKVRL